MRIILAGLASAVLAFLIFCGAAAADPPSISSFLEESGFADVAIAPDGERLAILVVEDETQHVNILNARTLEVQRSIPLSTNLHPAWVVWANSNRLLIAVRVGEFSVTSRRITFPASRILAMDADGTNIAVLFENQRTLLRTNFNLAVVTDILPDDPNHVLMPGVRNGDLDLWKVNVYTGEAVRVAYGGPSTFAWRTDADGTPAFRYDINRRRTVLQVFAPDAEGNWRRIATVREEDLPEFQPVAVGPEPGLSYVIARPEGADRAAVYLYDQEQGQFRQTVAEDSRVDITGVFINPRTYEYLGYYVFDDIYEVHLNDRRMQAHVDGLRRFFGQDTSLSLIDMSEGARMWIVGVSGPNDPGSLYLYDRDNAHLEPLGVLNPALQAEQLGASRVVRYPARDGVQITGYLTLPAHAAEGPYPLVLMPHGGPEMRDIFNFDRDAQFLATRGYAVFQPNFRGSSGYGKSFAEAGYGEWGGLMQDDLTDAVAYLIAEAVAEQGRICIMGASYGGYAALAGAAFTPDTYRCAISIAGVSSLVDQSRHVLREGDEDERDYIRRSIGDPRSDRERLSARSPVDHAGAIVVPVLLIHGDQDGIVPVDQSRKMQRALVEAGGDVRYVEIPDEGHSYWSDEHETLLLTEVETFLAEHLPVQAAH